MANFYFTFGSHPDFPYGIDEFVQVIAPTLRDAGAIFRKHHPDRPESPGILNCSFFYTEDQFNRFRDKYYSGKAPIEVLTA